MKNYKKTIVTVFTVIFSCITLVTSANAAEEKVLNVYNWIDYIGTDTIEGFEKETGIKVQYDTYEDNETLDEALRSKKVAYDVVVPSSDWAKSQIDDGLLIRLDKSKLPNFKNLDADFLEKIKDTDPNNAYMAGYLWGYTTIGLNVEKVVKLLGKTPIPKNLWDLVFNPIYSNKLKACGITFLDSAGDIMPIALHYVGKPAYSENPADYTLALNMLKKVRPHIKEFSSTEQAEKLASESMCVVVGYGGDFYRARKISEKSGKALNIAPVFPASGGLLFFDNMAIPANAKHPDNAHKFINYILKAEVHAKITHDTHYASPNLPAKKFMDVAMSNDRSLMLTKTDFGRLTAPKAVDEKTRTLRADIFERFKAAK